MKRMPMNRLIAIIFCVLLSNSTEAQIAGKKAFAFLNLPASARQVALGSNFISALDNDISLSWNNPAALNARMHNHAFATYNNYIGDIKSGYFCYARHFKKLGTFSAGIMYIDYGKFNGYTDAGISTGVFNAQDQCFQVSYGRSLNDKFKIGASLKYEYSIYESFVSNGVSTDISGIYHDSAQNLIISGFIRNLGIQAIPYAGTERKGLPTEIAIALSKRLEHLPFRYQLILNNLQAPDMRYTITQTGEKDENGKAKFKTMTIGDNILRHIALGGELNLSKNFVIRFGYNHMRRKEMTQDQKRGSSGFSWGIGFRISKFHLSYGSAAYFPGHNSNQFSLLLNLSELYKKK